MWDLVYKYLLQHLNLKEKCFLYSWDSTRNENLISIFEKFILPI